MLRPHRHSGLCCGWGRKTSGASSRESIQDPQPKVSRHHPDYDMKVHFLYNEAHDWVGLYIDGQLVFEGHNIGSRKLANILAEMFDWIVTSEEKSCDWFDERGGGCPKELEG
jgi:hypothetical protein